MCELAQMSRRCNSRRFDAFPVPAFAGARNVSRWRYPWLGDKLGTQRPVYGSAAKSNAKGRRANRRGRFFAGVGIFISYRREDARAHAGRLYARLSARFGGGHVFMDIEPGENFVRVLEQTLSSCDVLIGKRWIDADGGTSRLDDPGEFVRLEIEKALSGADHVDRRSVDFAGMMMASSRSGVSTFESTPASLI
jgi:hypothetical protein